MSRTKYVERLVRTVRLYGPDGNSVEKIETMIVDIEWPAERPTMVAEHGYTEYGCWKLALEEIP